MLAADRRKVCALPVPRRQSIRILVADEDEPSATAVAAILRDEGYETVVAGSGAAATAALAQSEWALLLLDPSFGDGSGPRVLSQAEALGVPKVIMTSDPAFDPGRAGRASVEGFFYKPVRVPTLLGLVESLLAPGRPN